MRSLYSFTVVAILAIAALPAAAQPILSAKSGVIANIEGKVLIDGNELQESATHFPEVKEGAILRTEEGRVELMLPPGFMLRMGENSALKMISNRLIDTRVEMQAGSAVVEVDQTKPDFNVVIALKDGVVTLSKVGVYRFDADPARIKVFHGSASVELGGQTVLVSSGRMLALAGASASAEKFDVEQTDSLDNWSQRHAEAMAVANLSGAKYANDSYGTSAGGNSWAFNPYYGMYTYIPGAGTMCNSFYGLCFYSPYTAYRAFYYGGLGYGIPGYGYYGGYPSVNTSSGTSAAATRSTPGFSGGIASYSGNSTGASAPATGGSVGGGGISGGMSGGGHAGGGGLGGGGTGGRGK